MIAPLLETLLAGRAADSGSLEAALHRILAGDSDVAQTAGLLVALRITEPDAATLAACARAMRNHRKAVVSQVRPLVDTCGTGGDKSGTFNISTAAALVVAAAGGAVAKHGNRSVSSITGSADVLEACGAPLHLEPAQASRILDATGFVFLFAPAFHPAMAHVGPARRALGIRTLFNVLGPLANPALADRQLIGVYDPSLTETVANALGELGSAGALVVHCDGLDEIGLHAPTRGHRLADGVVSPIEIPHLRARAGVGADFGAPGGRHAGERCNPESRSLRRGGGAAAGCGGRERRRGADGRRPCSRPPDRRPNRSRHPGVRPGAPLARAVCRNQHAHCRVTDR